MKNKKFKLFASLTSLVMVVAVMAVGVWAATSAKATISGTVTFNSTGFTASYNVKQGDTDLIATTTIGAANNDTMKAEDVVLNFTTGEDGTVASITLTFSMTNIVTENSITHSLALDASWIEDEDEDTENTYIKNNVQAVITSGILAEGGNSITSTIEFSIIDVAQSVTTGTTFTITDSYTAS